jgi:hypothetical protein
LSTQGDLRAQQSGDLLPNLEALPAYDIQALENFGGVLELRFSVRTWNSGAGPLELIAGEVDKGRQYVRQRIYDDDGNYEEHLAGKFEWHQGHNHFHFEDYALYTLQSVQGKSKRNSTKTSFCLMDTDLIDGQLPGAPKNSAYENCGNFFQGISVGWADEYGSELPGQSVDLTRLKDGDYRLIIEADPKNRLIETNDNDNTSCVLLHISVTAQTVSVLNPNNCDSGSEPPAGGEVTVNSIDPNSAAVGASVSVTIVGTGFTDGVDVMFDNGQGSKPVANDVVVVSATEIQANVTIKKRGGNKSDNIWDLVIGSGTLQDAFIVLP